MTWFVDLMGGTADRIYEGADVPLFEVVASPNGQLLAAVGEDFIITHPYIRIIERG